MKSNQLMDNQQQSQETVLPGEDTEQVLISCWTENEKKPSIYCYSPAEKKVESVIAAINPGFMITSS